MRIALAAAAMLLALVQPAAAGEVVVQPATVQDMKAVFGQVQSRDTVSARARIGGTLISRRSRRAARLRLAT